MCGPKQRVDEKGVESSDGCCRRLHKNIAAVTNDGLGAKSQSNELKIREECTTFWNRTNACMSPLFRISTDVNSPTQFASRAWPLSDLLSTQQSFFTSQWHGQLESVRVSAHIEASAALNPFGRVAECDQGVHPKIAFNLSRLNARTVVIDSQCFHAKVLVKFDTKCPYCPAAKAKKLRLCW
uniref:C2 domain-containing protein n=1 Tax=Caenorhabditis japonica TaxID=281687 RepID=A0A8R1EX89_CAEJA